MMPEGRHFVVPVHDLDLTGRDVHATITKEWLDAVLAETELRRAGPEGELDVHISKTGNDVLVRGAIRVALEIDCARCLEPVRLDRPLELTLLLHPAPATKRPQGSPARPTPHRELRKADGPKPSGKPERKPSRTRTDEEYEFSADEADTDVYEGDEVVLDRFVREAILLEEPIFPLCSDACEGIRPPPHPPGEAADATQAPDPRLARIADLLAKRKTKE